MKAQADTTFASGTPATDALRLHTDEIAVVYVTISEPGEVTYDTNEIMADLFGMMTRTGRAT